jgi:hypothetical protein
MEKRFNFIKKKHPIPKCNLLIYTTQKKECNYLLCLIIIHKDNKCKSFNTFTFNQNERVKCRHKRYEEKRISNKACTHRIMRTKRI